MFRYPHARLYVHNLLSGEGLTGGQAIEESAKQLGLIFASHDDCEEPLHSDNGCTCMLAARRVLNKHFEKSAEKAGTVAGLGAVPVDRNLILSAFEAEAKKLDIHPEVKTGNRKDSIKSNCLKHAPALMDVLLQQVTRYS